MKDLEGIILFQIERTSKVAKKYSQRELDKINFGITIEQWILLKIIHESKELSQKELANRSLRDPAAITRTLDLLAKKDLIERKDIPNNRRQYNISLTTMGMKFIEENLPIIKGQREQSLKGFNEEEIKSLKSMLLRIQENMS